jgi:hypothetical protein
MDEDRARRRVVEGLAERFGELPRSLVEQVVSDAWSGLDSGRVRDFVPILVARVAGEVLSEVRRVVPQGLVHADRDDHT